MPGCILDLDGLLIDSERLSFQAWGRVLAEYGRRLEADAYPVMIGMDSAAAARYVLERTGVPLAVAALEAAHWGRLRAIIAQGLEPMPGAVALVEAVRARGCPLGLASNSPCGYVESALRAIGLRDAFGCVIGGDQVARGKPAPDPYLAAAACLGVPPERCLAVEDSPLGLQSALAAGMRCAVVPNEHLPGGDFSGAYARFASLDAVREALDGLLSGL